MSKKSKLGVVGGGISGIATAYYLRKKGFDVDIIEAEPDIGGRVGSDFIGDRRIEFGGKNIGRNYPQFRAFVREMGDYEYEYFGINTSTQVNNKARVIDSEKKIRSIINLVTLIGVRDALRLLRMVMAIRRDPDNGYLGGPYFRQIADRHDALPVSSHFGRRFCRNFLRPLTIRMNGAEPENYFWGNLGSNIKMIMDQYDQLEQGVFSVIKTFSGDVRLRTGTRVTGVVQQGGRVLGVTAEVGGRTSTLLYDGVIFATPAAVTTKLLAKSHPQLSGLLRSIRYNPVAIAVAKYNRPIFEPQTRAQVFGSDHALSNAGAYGISDLDIVRYTFSGKRAVELFDESSDPLQVLEAGEAVLAQHRPVSAREREGFVYRYFRNGLCAYAPHHARLMQQIKAELEQNVGLVLAGDYLKGAAIEACFIAGAEAADAVAAQIALEQDLQGAV